MVTIGQTSTTRWLTWLRLLARTLGTLLHASSAFGDAPDYFEKFVVVYSTDRAEILDSNHSTIVLIVSEVIAKSVKAITNTNCFKII